VAQLIDRVLMAPEDTASLKQIKSEVNELMSGRPLFAG